MSTVRRNNYFRIATADWPDMASDQIAPEKLKAFNDRKAAIRAFEKGSTFASVQKHYRIAAKELIRFIARCQKDHEDERIWGYRALVPRTYVEEVTRTSAPKNDLVRDGRGTRGLFKNLLKSFPKLEELLKAQAGQLEQSKHDGKRVLIKNLHIDFLKLCRTLISDHESSYPFNLAHQGFEGYKAALHSARMQIVAAAEPDYSRDPRSSKWRDRPYSNVEIDAHKLDAIIKIKVPLPNGSTKIRQIDRLWVLVARDRKSRSVLSYNMVIAREVNRLDLLTCIQRISIPWTKRELSIPGLSYEPKAGFPSGVLPHCAGRMADMYHLDNAMAHLSRDAQYAILETLYGTVNWGVAGDPDARAIIETFFKWLTEGLIQQLPTGFTKKKTSHKDASICAETQSPTAEEMLEFLDVVLANFNCRDNRGLFGQTPLEHLAAENPKNLFRSDMGEEASWRSLSAIKQTFSVKKTGSHAVHVNYLEAKYRSEALSSMVRRGIESFDAYVDLNDLRTIKPIAIDGWIPDDLLAEFPWGTFKHDIRLRKSINREMRLNGFRFDPNVDALDCFRKHLQRRAVEEKRAATELTRINSNESQSPPSNPVQDNFVAAPEIAPKATGHLPTKSALAAMFNDDDELSEI
ncbi:MAG: hypothetical protein Q8Q73_05950 [Stagnimonas sp.]|nr:hypothetical protein [Stagnimonas sp.]